MKQLKKKLLLVIMSLTLLLNFAVPGLPIHAEETNKNDEAQTDEYFELTIMHVNDSHARVDTFPYLKPVIDKIRAENENHLLLHAGDVFSGTLYFTLFKGQADLEMMNALEFDAMTFGNHEFDEDSEVLANFVKDAQFPFVSANIDFSKDPILSPYFKQEIAQAGQFNNGEIYPAIIKEFNGELVGIFGLTTEDTPTIASPSEYITFNNAKEAAEETVSQLEELGINKIIALSHLGYNFDQQLAEQVDGIDVIVGGHSHDTLSEGTYIDKAEPTVIVQAGDNLNNLGVLDVTFNDEGIIQDYDAKLTEIDKENMPQDEALAKELEKYEGPIAELKEENVGETTVALDGERANVRTKETNLGNLIADGMVWKMKQFVPETTIALQNGGGIRASIDEGKITMGEVLTVLPFGNSIVSIKLTGQEIWEALEHSVSKYPEQSGGFLHVSGLRFEFDPDQPAYERVLSVEVLTDDGTYEPIDLDEYYFVATNSFTAKGGDDFESLKQAYEDGRMTNYDIPDYVAFSEYLIENSPVSPKVEGRIVNIKDIGETPEKPEEEPGEEPGNDQDETPEDPGQKPGDENGDDKTPGKQDETTGQKDKTPTKTENGEDVTKQDGEKLPATATNHFNILLSGIALIVVGTVAYLIFRFKYHKVNN